VKSSRRLDAARKWQLVAEERFDDPGVREWLVDVARALLKANELADGNARKTQFGEAVGLKGSKRTDDVQTSIQLVMNLPVSALGLGPCPTDVEIRRARRELVAQRCGLTGSVDDPHVRKRLNERIRVALKRAGAR
jgi:hypothetical protein